MYVGVWTPPNASSDFPQDRTIVLPQWALVKWVLTYLFSFSLEKPTFFHQVVPQNVYPGPVPPPHPADEGGNSCRQWAPAAVARAWRAPQAGGHLVHPHSSPRTLWLSSEQGRPVEEDGSLWLKTDASVGFFFFQLIHMTGVLVPMFGGQALATPVPETMAAPEGFKHLPWTPF